jgi:hypothetical protein
MQNKSNTPTNSTSRPESKTQAVPLLPALAVRPQRWENVLVSVGGSNWMTTSTLGRSKPRAATSVARSMDGEDGEATADANAPSVRVRAVGERLPCRE